MPAYLDFILREYGIRSRMLVYSKMQLSHALRQKFLAKFRLQYGKLDHETRNSHPREHLEAAFLDKHLPDLSDYPADARFLMAVTVVFPVLRQEGCESPSDWDPSLGDETHPYWQGRVQWASRFTQVICPLSLFRSFSVMCTFPCVSVCACARRSFPLTVV